MEGPFVPPGHEMHRGAPIPSRSTKAPRALTGRRPPIAGDAARRRRGLGQSLAEFAILLPLLLILIVGIADFGRLERYQSSDRSQTWKQAEGPNVFPHA